ncbi:MAG: hypothetical protein LBL51_03825, partial [Synergistaceae bacterium]|nr:hypothetical protein [Synergistaceae bacterium]
MSLLLLTAAIAWSVPVLSAWAATAESSERLPEGHRAYSLTEQLAKRGIIDISSLTLTGDRRATRGELASALAECLRTLDPGKLEAQDIETLNLLIAEFKGELDALGVKYKTFRRPLFSTSQASLSMLKNRVFAESYYGAAVSSAPGASMPGFSGAALNAYPAPMPQETARYADYDDNPVKLVARDPLSTFSLDVNTT